MKVAILRRFPKASVSMDVYTAGLMRGLMAVRPDWEFIELYPSLSTKSSTSFSFIDGIQKYYERYWRFPNNLKHIEADIFHIIDHSDGYLSRWLQNYRYPNIVTCHDLINLINPETFQGRARLPLVSMTAWRWGVEGMRHADHVITVSSYTKQDVVQHLGITSSTITVIPNAVDTVFRCLPAEEIQSVRNHYGLTSDTLCLLNVGSNNSRKNISGILAAIVKLNDQEIPVHFWKVGADFNAEQKQFIQDHALSSCVSYLGQPDEPHLVQLYNAADCLMAPSFYEGFGLTILEGMACGTPVVTANISAMPEVAGDSAILVDPFDVSAIAQAVHNLYRNPSLCQELVHKGLEHVKRFTWEGTGEQVAKVYEKVLESSSISKPKSVFLESTNWPL
ncbi:MAG: glycosyltransferase family 4 protein [Thainema sp.]